MANPLYRKGIERNAIWIVPLVASGFIFAAIGLGLWHAAEMRNIVTRQFNDEQLVIAGNAAGLIERELAFLEKELRLISEEIAAGYQESRGFKPEAIQPVIEKSMVRVVESGVRKIRVIDESMPGHTTHHHISGEHWITQGLNNPVLPSSESIPEGSMWFSSPLGDSTRLNLYMVTPIPSSTPALVVFDINISWFLNPFVKNIRSGKTGYAWIICENGFFLYHAKTEFIGRDAFNVRREEGPHISFHTIDFIQKEKMLKGFEGTGSYESGWHGGVVGKIRKLIAYAPIHIGNPSTQNWSIAVVAPMSEIAGLIKDAYNRQLLLQLLILVVIIGAACTVMLFEKRWSRILETEVAEQTRAFRHSEEKYRSLVESAEDFIFTIDENGRFQSINPFAASFFGGKPADYANVPLSSLFPARAAEKINQLIKQVFLEKKSVRDTVEITMADGRTWINANFMPLRNKRRQVGAVLCIARDITEQKNLESRLINAEKLASMGTLAAGVAHEINNPLGIILGFSDILVRKTDPETQEYEDLKTIERQGLHCKQIVENLLSFARHGEETSETTDINECIEEVIKIVRHTLNINNIDLRMNLPDPSPMVTGDFRQLQQVFLNLINNAVSAMPDSGELRISAQTKKADQGIAVSISDTGTGIPEKDINRIFDPFFTTKPEGEGTGLGLFVSYGIISRYGGTIECESETDDTSGRQGTLFTISLQPAPEKQDNA